MTNKELCTHLHQYSVSNKQSILASNRCGCFFCKRIFDSKLISAPYINDKGGETAMCPFCGVDSVLPDNSVELSFELLEKMHRVWFGMHKRYDKKITLSTPNGKTELDARIVCIGEDEDTADVEVSVGVQYGGKEA